MAIQTINFANGSDNGVVETTHEGLVIYEGEHNHYDDSDFYAIVWNPEKKVEEEIIYASTRYPSYGNRAVVDFDKEKYGKEYDKYLRICSFVAYMENTYSLIGTSADKGKRVKVVKGRKVPIGTIGTIFSVKKNEYARQRSAFMPENNRIMIKTDDGKYLDTYLFNLSPLPPTSEQKEQAWKDFVGELDNDYQKFA